MKKKSINLVTLGCSKNQVDSEVLASEFKNAGYDVFFESPQDHNIVLINTCSFILDAKEQSIETILEYAEKKRSGSIEKLYVIGCLVERYKKELEDAIPEVDGFYGFAALSQMIHQPSFDLLQNSNRLLSTPPHYAYLKISEGCDRQCAFCAIPSIRGKHVSKPIELLITEAKSLAAQGVKELMLIAQDLTYYGIDIYHKRSLDKLLEKLAQVDGIEWIRMHYAYPASFPYEILDVMNEYKNICRYLDIPLQHISDSVLKSMNRGNNSSQTYKLIETIRTKVPGIALRTTLISGFPTETLEHHKELLRFIEEVRFERLGVFSYSREEGTPAYPLGNPVKKSEKKRRLDELMALQQKISKQLNEAKIGTQFPIIIDEKDDSFYYGRSEFDSPEVDNSILIRKESPLTIGNFYTTLITEADTFDLFGKIV